MRGGVSTYSDALDLFPDGERYRRSALHRGGCLDIWKRLLLEDGLQYGLPFGFGDGAVFDAERCNTVVPYWDGFSKFLHLFFIFLLLLFRFVFVNGMGESVGNKDAGYC